VVVVAAVVVVSAARMEAVNIAGLATGHRQNLEQRRFAESEVLFLRSVLVALVAVFAAAGTSEPSPVATGDETTKLRETGGSRGWRIEVWLRAP
jgi:hypothetical protein